MLTDEGRNLDGTCGHPIAAWYQLETTDEVLTFCGLCRLILKREPIAVTVEPQKELPHGNQAGN